MKKQLVFNPPPPDSPGYLRRARKSLEFRQAINQKDAGPETIDSLVDFLLPYVEEPKDRPEAKEALLDATEAQFLQLIDVVSGNAEENPTSAQPMKEQSNSGQAE